ncbi:MAG: helix-turn-helix domain-containing protein [Lachnospiraceae bacterium]|nr:helix-turn-helix domain-containing protein [Lachnospiraceae bacterium]
MENPFKELRYSDNLTHEEIISQKEVAARTGLSTSAVSKIEQPGSNPRLLTIKDYHKAFPEVSYEYLMGETATKDAKYHAIGEIFPFDDSFYNNLKQLLELDSGNQFVEYMLSALLYNPQALYTALITVFDTLYQINNIQQNKELSSSDKAKMSKMHEYIFSQSVIDYLENNVMPLLGRGFEAKNKYLSNEAQDTEKAIRELYSGTESSVTVENIKVTPITNDKD